MIKDNTSSFSKLEQNFKELLMERCGRLPSFMEVLSEKHDFKFPEITEDLLEPDTQCFISIPGMFGGFAYYLEEMGDKFVLYAEQSSRMNHDSNDYLYFEITESGSKKLEGEEREIMRKKFCDLAKKTHEKHLQKLKAMRESERAI